MGSLVEAWVFSLRGLKCGWNTSYLWSLKEAGIFIDGELNRG